MNPLQAGADLLVDMTAKFVHRLVCRDRRVKYDLDAGWRLAEQAYQVPLEAVVTYEGRNRVRPLVTPVTDGDRLNGNPGVPGRGQQ